MLCALLFMYIIPFNFPNNLSMNIFNSQMRGDIREAKQFAPSHVASGHWALD